MATALAPLTHVHTDDRGILRVGGTRFRVTQIVAEHVHNGWSAEEICYQHYGLLTLGQVHAVLSYYYDHPDEVDSAFQREDSEVKQLRRKLGQAPAVARLKRQGLLR